MHKIDIDTVEMTLDVMKYAINRISATEHPISLSQRSGC